MAYEIITFFSIAFICVLCNYWNVIKKYNSVWYRYIIDVVLIAIPIIFWYIKNGPYNLGIVTATITTIFGIAISIIGTALALQVANNSTTVTIKQYELVEKETQKKFVEEIYNNFLAPLQYVLSDLQQLGDYLFSVEDRKKDIRGNVELKFPQNIELKLNEHINIFSAKLNMVILYTTEEKYAKYFSMGREIQETIKTIMKSYSEKVWTEDTTKSFLKGKDVADNLYLDLQQIIIDLTKIKIKK
jgi:hypothetical protein